MGFSKYRSKPLSWWLQTPTHIKNRLHSILHVRQPFPSRVPFAEIRFQQVTAPILVVSHRERQCGIQQYGLNITEALRKSARYRFEYVECSTANELDQALAKTQYSAIIYNYYPATMPWVKLEVTRKHQIPQLALMHEVTQEEADNANQTLFDYHLLPDPTVLENNTCVFKTPRLIPSYINTTLAPSLPTIGSFGFGFGDKGFERLCKTVQDEFEAARICLRLPFNDVVDKDGAAHALATAQRCRAIVTKPGIELDINHDFTSKTELLDFLASNTINCFFYDVNKHRGISSTIEHALAVQRPLAITRSGMFRHVSSATPSICIEDSNVKTIISNGVTPLEPFYEAWSESAFLAAYERILDEVFTLSNAK